MAKPIVKWAGGKTKLLEPLTQRVPTQIRTYAEPFAGGAALFFALADDPSRTIERAVLMASASRCSVTQSERQQVWLQQRRSLLCTQCSGTCP